ncbi:MAG: hypothetical protein WC744_01350 [Patescibacteria group bacterium]|jgi:hypothetical protein
MKNEFSRFVGGTVNFLYNTNLARKYLPTITAGDEPSMLEKLEAYGLASACPEALRGVMAKSSIAKVAWLTAVSTSSIKIVQTAITGAMISKDFSDKLNLNNLESAGIALIAFGGILFASRIALNVYQNVLVKMFGDNLFAPGISTASVLSSDRVLQGVVTVAQHLLK